MNYKEVVENFHVFLSSINSDISNIKISEDKWSLREIIGHLIDSASNNHQRFVRLQYSDLLDFPAYEAEQSLYVFLIIIFTKPYFIKYPYFLCCLP